MIGATLLAVLALMIAGCRGDLISRLEQGDRPDGAREKLQALAVHDPNNLKVQAWLIRLELEDGDLAAAEKRLSMLKIKAPRDYATISGTCFYYLKKGGGEIALPACEEAALMSGRSYDDLGRLAIAYLQTERFNQAIPILTDLKKQRPSDPKALANLGYAYLLKKEYPQAISLFQEAIKRDPHFIVARKNLARAWHATNEFQKSADELKAILAITPQDKEVLFNLVIIYAYSLKDPKQAGDYAAKALPLETDLRRRQLLVDIITLGKRTK